MAEKQKDKKAKDKQGVEFRKKPACPKCGEGTSLAEHADRLHCGRCGYTKWKQQTPS